MPESYFARFVEEAVERYARDTVLAGRWRAEEAAGATNEGDGEPGVCPKCQLVPLRVWDTFVSDQNSFAQAVVYAADNDVSVTYWMNPLQGIDDDKPLFVSLNPPLEPDPALTFGKYRVEHPQYNAAAFAAQNGNSAPVHGTVTDPTGAVIPGATVHLTNPVSGLDRTVTTDPTGAFEIPNVPFNKYTVDLSAPGFAPLRQSIDIHSVVATSLNLVLQIAAATHLAQDI